MEDFSKKLAGSSLLLGSLMAILTMVLHPIGGDIQHIVKISGVLMFSHSLAVVCMPLIAFGFWGLSNLLTTPNRLSILAFFIALLGLIAATLAATINGMVLPQFASHYAGSKVDSAVLLAIISYGRFLNQSLAYIFMVSTIFSILLLSFLLITKRSPIKWFGYYGILVFLLGLVALLVGANMISVHLFGYFVVGMTSWMMMAGVVLIRSDNRYFFC